MQLAKGITIMHPGLCIANNLVLSDIHLGYEESQNKKGILLPRICYKEIINCLTKSLGGKRFDSIIINGDIKHEFGSIATTEWRNILSFIDFLHRYSSKICIIEGNHDHLLKHVVAKRNVLLTDHVKIGSTYITHGDKVPKNPDFEAAETVVIGHDHPAISLRRMTRVETYKCFLKGKWHGKKVIVMPSCNPLTEGSNILSTESLSPFLEEKEDFEVYIVDIAEDKVYDFGKIKSLHERSL